jgi:3-oxoacyl-[acyl-carrier protein] reductase
MDLGLFGRVAVVMGASQGIGLAVAHALAGEGCDVAIASRNRQRIESAGQSIAKTSGRRVLADVVDVTRGELITAFVQRVQQEFGRTDVLVNNSGGPRPGQFADLSDADFHQAVDLLLLNVVRTTRALLPMLRASDQGRIITITSTSTREPIDNLLLSNAVRSAVLAWSKSLSRELAAEGITVNCLAPGRINTERLAELDQATAKKTGQSVEQVRAAIQATIPLGRYGRPEEIGDAVAFLASRRAGYITGVQLAVDGGKLAGY